jgi:antirestriction protein ArdC
MGRTPPSSGALQALDAKMDALTGGERYRPEDIAVAGVILCLDHDGEPLTIRPPLGPLKVELTRAAGRGTAAEWLKPWSTERLANRVTRPLRHNGVGYQGINVLMLWGEAMAKGYAAPIWMTFKQALVLGGCVRKGEKGSLDYAKPAPRTPVIQRIERPEHFFTATRATIRHGGDRAYYAAGTDHIQMPPVESFRDAESYYATLAHEETHWTKHKSRLDRDLGRKRWGDEGYAMEELVAPVIENDGNF